MGSQVHGQPTCYGHHSTVTHMWVRSVIKHWIKRKRENSVELEGLSQCFLPRLSWAILQKNITPLEACLVSLLGVLSNIFISSMATDPVHNSYRGHFWLGDAMSGETIFSRVELNTINV